MRKCANTNSSRSEELIEEGLLGLLASMPLKDVTVTAICRNAGVSRQTFYRYFDTPADALDQYLYNTVIKYTVKHPPSATDPAGNVREFFTNLPFDKDLLEMIGRNNLFPRLEKVMCFSSPLISRAIKAPVDEEYERMKPYFDHFASSTYAMVLQIWTAGGFKERPEELADLVNMFFSGVASQYS